MKITHTITINAEEIEAALWEGAEKAAEEYCDRLAEDGYKGGIKRGKFEIKRWTQSRTVVVYYAGKPKFTIAVPYPEDVEQGEDGKLHVRNDKLSIRPCRK